MGQEQLHLGPRNLFQQGSIPQACPTSTPFIHVSCTNGESSCHLCCWLTNYESEVPSAPSSALIHLPEWLTELRKTVHLLNYQSIILLKGGNTKTAKWKRCLRQGCGKGPHVSVPTLGVSLLATPHVDQPGGFLNPIVWVFCGDRSIATVD